MHPSSGTDSSPEVSGSSSSLPAVPWQISFPDGRQNSPYKVVPRYIPRLTAGRRHSPQCFSPPADILPENAWRKPLSCQKLPFPDFLSYMLHIYSWYRHLSLSVRSRIVISYIRLSYFFWFFSFSRISSFNSLALSLVRALAEGDVRIVATIRLATSISGIWQQVPQSEILP